jgi:tetratricopeptide (TPR) repeat protein
MQTAVDLEPRLPQSHWYLALTYKIAKKYELAAKEMEESERLGDPWLKDLSDINQAIEVYRALANNDRLMILYESAVQLSTSDVQLWAGLADISRKLGYKEKAKMAAEELLKLSPESATSVADFLKELGY